LSRVSPVQSDTAVQGEFWASNEQWK